MSKFIPIYDLESLNEAQRQEYVSNLCKHMGVPPELNLVMLTYLDEDDGPRRLVAYAKRGATEIIRNNLGINVTKLEHAQVGGSIVWTATAVNRDGRQEMASGSKWIKDLAGHDLDDAIMTAQTRACRRVTLQFTGAGVLDESEVKARVAVELKNITFVPPDPQPQVEVSSAPATDITETKKETPEEFSKKMETLRQEAIDQLNAAHKKEKPEENLEEKKEPKRRGRRAKVDLGPGEPPAEAKPTPAPAPTPVLTPPVTVAVTVPVTAPATIAPVSKARLSADEVKPYRQRLFNIINNQLEPAGFAPKEGMGNTTKMRNFALIMFSGITDLNEMTKEQWEKYVSTLENMISVQGAQQTIQYIEETIGV